MGIRLFRIAEFRLTIYLEKYLLLIPLSPRSHLNSSFHLLFRPRYYVHMYNPLPLYWHVIPAAPSSLNPIGHSNVAPWPIRAPSILPINGGLGRFRTGHWTSGNMRMHLFRMRLNVCSHWKIEICKRRRENKEKDNWTYPQRGHVWSWIIHEV